MGQETEIQWTNMTWNPVTGCTKVSAGCKNCYAETIAKRFWGDREFGDVQCHPERLDQPLHWRKPRKVFVNSMSDLFHPDVPFDFIDRVFAVMALCPQHTFQVLTKRPKRMAEYLTTAASPLDKDRWDVVSECACHIGRIIWDPRGLDDANYWGVARYKKGDAANRRACPGWPLPNVHIGTSCENQQAADERIPHLLRCPAAVRFLSLEPLLGPINLRPYFAHSIMCERLPGPGMNGGEPCRCGQVHWVIVGCESGPNRRPMEPDWARSIVEQCRTADVPVFVKQIEVAGKVTTDIAAFPADLQYRQYPEATR